MRWFRRSKTPPPDPIDPALVELARAELALHLAEEGMCLVHIPPDRIAADDYGDPREPGPEHMLAGWQYRAGAWVDLPSAAFFALKKQDGATWTQFAILAGEETATVYWWRVHFFAVEGRRRGRLESGGGMFQVVRAADGWRKPSHLGPTLAELRADALYRAVLDELGPRATPEGELLIQFTDGPRQAGLEVPLGCWVMTAGEWQPLPLDEFWWRYWTGRAVFTRFVIRRQADQATIAFAWQMRISYGGTWGGMAAGRGGEYHATCGSDGVWTLELGNVWVN